MDTHVFLYNDVVRNAIPQHQLALIVTNYFLLVLQIGKCDTSEVV